MESLDNYLSVGWGLAHQAYSNLTLEWVINRILTAPARYRRWWLHLLEHAPGHVIVETALIIFILWLLLFKKTEDPYKEELHLTEKEIDELVTEWKPEPLTPEPDPVWYEDPNVVVTRVDGNLLHATGYAKPLLNFGTFDFLGMSQRPEVKDAARACLLKYGCGSCGPRGFYGTIDVHVHCEEAVSRFLGTEEAISYSDSASAVSSTLPAFAKRGDLLLIDEGASEPILTAANLSRSTVKFFKHNDMKDLERLLKGIASDDKRVNRNALEQRRFIVVEGLYKNFGNTAPLKELIALKKKYFYRLFLDETHSFGCYGKGRGITELYDVPITEIDILCVSMAHALASVGGLCAGTHEVVDHQRLSGAGYCFSASAPPFVSGAAIAAIKILENEPGLVDRLQENARRLHDGIANIAGLEVRSERGSPILHVGMSPSLNLSRNDAAALLRRIANLCLQDGIAIVTSKFVGNEPLVPPPSLRITVCATHTTEHLDEALAVLRRVTAAILEA